MLQYYDFNAQTTGAAFPVSSPGRFLYYLAGSAGGADSTIIVRAGNTGQSVLLKPGQSVRLADSDKSVDTWFISNYAKSQPILGQLLVGDGYFEDNRISGSVEVIDGGMNRTISDSAFMGLGGNSAGAGLYSQVQLWNPTAAMIAVVKRVVISSATAGIFYLSPSTAAAATNGGNCASKKIGSGALSQGQIRYDKVAAPIVARFHAQNIVANTSYEIKLEEPLVVMPGTGLIVWGGLNQDLTATFEFYEKAA